MERTATVFGSEGHGKPAEPETPLKALHAKSGELTLDHMFA